MVSPNLIEFAKMIRPALADDALDGIRHTAARSLFRGALNSLYTSLSPEQKTAFHGRYAGIFRSYEGKFDEGLWQLRFCDKPIVVPLRPNFAWLDWDAALSIEGHEPELKTTYATLLRMKNPPRLVLDIGANYGTHSILFLTHGIETISFEPNPACHGFFRALCDANRVKYRLEPLAFGDSEGSVDFWYPEREEWLGTTNSNVMREMNGTLLKLKVEQTTVDMYVQSHRLKPDLLKIDTEGTDLEVLRGAAWTLEHHRPVVLFESRESGKAGIRPYLDALGYRICSLPVLADSAPRPLTAEEFCASPEPNFAAIHEDPLAAWPAVFE
jgi:FkbM family methyltransferase